MKVVFLGATQGMGRALARLMAERGDELFLLGRHLATLQGQAADLRIRGASTEVGVAVCDLERPQGFGAALDAATAGDDTAVGSCSPDMDTDGAGAAAAL